MNRSEHIKWAKERALEFCNRNELNEAFTSLANDLSRHPETANHQGLQVMTQLVVMGQLSTRESMAKFIEGFQ